jgi:hypothetical protein
MGAPRNSEDFFLQFRVCRGSLLTLSRLLRRRTSTRGCPQAAAPNTLSGSGARSIAKSRHCRGSNPPRPRSSSVPPRRPVKATGSPPQRVRVRLRLGGRAAVRRKLNRSRPRYPPVPAGVQSNGRGPEPWRMETDGDQCPTRLSLTVSLSALVRGVPQLGVEFPGPGRRGFSSKHR